MVSIKSMSLVAYIYIINIYRNNMNIFKCMHYKITTNRFARLRFQFMASAIEKSMKEAICVQV